LSDIIFSPVVMTLYAVSLGLTLGLGATSMVLDRDYPVGRVHLGPWITWPKLGAADADPYTRVSISRRADIPLGLGEGIMLRAVADGAGQPLDPSCRYRIGSRVPQARLWTLTLYDEQERPIRTELGRAGFTSAEIVRDDGNGFHIELARDPRPGNWIQLPPSGRFTMDLRLYDVPGVAGASGLDAAILPSIERLDCGA
jgi:hypothetical protein